MLVGEMMRGVLRGFINAEKNAETKAVELRPGQVVKATVLQTFSNQEALLNIDGAKIRARLETPLKAGQIATLQVQNESTATQILLKPLAVNAEVSDEAVQDLLRNMSLKDSAANRMLAQQILSSPVPLSKEQLQQIKQVVAANPPQIPADEWNQAIVIAHNKGLPMTEESIRALHQVIFGKPLHESLTNLTQQLQTMIGQQKLSPQSQPKAEQLLQILNQMKELSAKITGNQEGTQSTKQAVVNRENAPTSGANAQVVSQANAQSAPNMMSSTTPLASTTPSANAASNPIVTGQAQTNVTTNVTQPQTTNEINTPARNMTSTTSGNIVNGNQIQNSVNQGVIQSPANHLSDIPRINANQNLQNVNMNNTGKQNVVTSSTNQSTGSVAAQLANPNVTNPTSATPVLSNPIQPQSNTANPFILTGPITNNWTPPANGFISAGAYSVEVQNGERQIVQQMLQQMGVQTEHALAQTAKQTNAEAVIQQAKQSAQQLVNQLTQPNQQQPSPTNPATALETFKGALMQLFNTADLPPALKSSVETLVQHITGQQLLLTPDKYGSFSYVTMTIPLFDKQDGQTAEVFIQSRKGKKGELDPKNCRLIFDLNMKSMGPTMVDLHIVNRIVNIYVMNDQEQVQQMIESSREEIAASLEQIGYQFLSLKVSEYPQKISELDVSADAEVPALKMPSQGGQNYRGVDYRV